VLALEVTIRNRGQAAHHVALRTGVDRHPECLPHLADAIAAAGRGHGLPEWALGNEPGEQPSKKRDAGGNNEHGAQGNRECLDVHAPERRR